MTLEPSAVFVCSQCGQCCSVWQVFVDKARRDALLAQPWVNKRLASLGLALESAGQQGAYLPLKPDLTCAFFEADTGCLIHQRMGADAKPIDCQRFPFAAVRLPQGGLTYDVSAACTTIVSHHLPTHTQVVPQGTEAQASVAFSQNAQHLSMMATPAPNFPMRVTLWPWPLSWLVGVLGSVLRLPASLPYTTFEERRLGLLRWLYADAVSSPLAMRAILACAWRWMVLGKPLPPHSLGHAGELGLPAWGLATTWALWRDLRTPLGWYQRGQWLRRWGYWDHQLLGEGVVVPWETIRRHPWPQAGGSSGRAQRRLLVGYVALVLTRRVGLVYGLPWLCQWLLAYRAVGLVAFYARVLSLRCEEAEVSVASMQLAVRVVERYYVSHQPRYAAKTEWDALGLMLALLRQS
jgi:Fe-S-cluster containining protein